MCGIVAAIADRNVLPILIDGLRRLEYRGYDSAGVAFVNGDGGLDRVCTVGKVAMLSNGLDPARQSPRGIAHTRWATHGGVTEPNAHPLVSGGQIAVVHNGIIENHQELHAELESAGYAFSSETDSEVVAHLVHSELARDGDLLAALGRACARLEGTYALAVLDRDRPDIVCAARRGSPLVVGLGDGEHFVASDAAALVPLTRRMVYLEDGDLVEIRRDGFRVVNGAGPVDRPVRMSTLTAEAGEKGSYPHFMLKEIHAQPDAIAATLEGHLDGARILPELDRGLLGRVRAIHIIACGTSYHAGLVARYWIEALAGVPVAVEIASEYRYRSPAVPDGTLMIAISQSGETADTLAALGHARTRGYLASLGICNVAESSITRVCDEILMTRAGLEIGVASTKAFTTQLAVLLLLAAALAETRGMEEERLREIIEHLGQAPQQAREVLAMEADVEAVAGLIADKHQALFLGRGPEFPIAMEGALKLKEVAYIHAEAYAAGELKHGPLALVDESLPVIVSASSNEVLKKLMSNLEEVRARGGRLYVFADRGVTLGDSEGVRVIRVPALHSTISPILQVIPLQLLAYYAGVLRGTDVDQPRNLAKSVTVE